MQINEKMLGLGSKRSIIREIFEYSKKRAQEIGADNVFDFSIGNPSVEPPKEVTKTLKKLIKKSNPTLLHGYTSAQGDLGVRSAISNKINSDYGTNLSPDNIYMTCGAAASLTISLKAVLNRGEECVVFAPYFTEYKVFIENAGGILVKSMPKEKTFQIDVDDLEQKINENTRAVIINSPNNPSGVVYTKETIKAVCELLYRKSKEFCKVIYVICDEPYRELVYGNSPIDSVPYLMNYYDNTLVCYSYSKSLSLPGERIGYIAVNPNMKNAREVYLAVCGAGRSLGYVCAPSLFQLLIKNCVNAKVDVNIYKENRDILMDSLKKCGFEFVQPDGAFYLFVKSPDKDAYAFYERAKAKDILFVPCDDFGVSGFVRIAYCVSKERIVKAIPAFVELAKEYGLN